MRLSIGRPVLPLAALFVAAILLLSLQDGALYSGPAGAAGSAPEMALTVRDGGFCVSTDCYAERGEDFGLAVSVEEAPSAGYILIQAYIDFGDFDPTASEDGAGANTCSDELDNEDLDGADRFDDDCVTTDLTYNPAATAADEFVWPDLEDAAAFRVEIEPAMLYLGGLTGLFNTPASDHEGDIIVIDMTCSATPSTTTLDLLVYLDPLAGTSGSMFVEADGVTQVTPKVSTMTMHCVGKQWPPGDTDGDGCRDVRENNADPAVGGDRDWLNPWDFYDVAIAGGVPGTDGVVDLSNDYLGVTAHYAPTGAPPYDVHYDRGPAAGPSWNDTTGPDGVIDLANDILGVARQIGHDCT